MQQRGMVLQNRHISWMLSGITFSCFITFMTGYFIGTHKKDNEPVCVTAALPLVENPGQPELQECAAPMLVQHEAPAQETVTESASVTQKQYYAHLIGFGTQKAAEQFIAKVAKKGIETQLRTRISRTAAGQARTWYQVVTHAYKTEQDLRGVLERLIEEEKLHDVKIVTC